MDISMIREPLAGYPIYAFPAPYRFRWYEPGDEHHWLSIHHIADIYSEHPATMQTYRRSFGSETAVLAQRQGYILDEQGQPVGTASAWFDDKAPDTHHRGRVHWVAILPEHQGKGLAKPLLSTICQRLEALGHETAVLDTSTKRITAVNLYAHFGFIPDIKQKAERKGWQQLQTKLKYQIM